MIKKVFFVILLVLFILSMSAFGYIFTSNLRLKSENKVLKEKIKDIVNNNSNIIDETEEYNKELSKLKEELKEKISEYEVWKETRDKIKTIIG